LLDVFSLDSHPKSTLGWEANRIMVFLWRL
jgi:hypothetical protein